MVADGFAASTNPERTVMEPREQNPNEVIATALKGLNTDVHNELVAFGGRFDNSLALIRRHLSTRTWRSLGEDCHDQVEAALGIAARLIRSLWRDFEADKVRTLDGDERPAKLDRLLQHLECIAAQLKPAHQALH